MEKIEDKVEEYTHKLYEKYRTESKDWNASLTALLDEIKKKIYSLNRIARVNVDDLRAYVERDKELRDNLAKIVTALVGEKVEEPKSLYQYPDKGYTPKDIAEWFDATENMYHFAQRYESQERGSCCSVDRAYSKYLIPECKKLLEKIRV